MIDKEQIKVILQKNGIIGLIGVGHFLTGIKGNKKNYEEAFFCHLENYLNEFGSKGLCIGSDFYGSDALVCESGDYSFVKKIVKRLELWGVSSKDINNLLYENAMHFFKLAVWNLCESRVKNESKLNKNANPPLMVWQKFKSLV